MTISPARTFVWPLENRPLRRRHRISNRLLGTPMKARTSATTSSAHAGGARLRARLLFARVTTRRLAASRPHLPRVLFVSVIRLLVALFEQLRHVVEFFHHISEERCVRETGPIHIGIPDETLSPV